LWFVVHDDGRQFVRMCVVKAKSPKAAKLQAQEDFRNTAGSEYQIEGSYQTEDMEVCGIRHLKDGWIR
jgi:hypothetical protein